jgi:hypothetical protein
VRAPEVPFDQIHEKIADTLIDLVIKVESRIRGNSLSS